MSGSLRAPGERFISITTEHYLGFISPELGINGVVSETARCRGEAFVVISGSRTTPGIILSAAWFEPIGKAARSKLSPIGTGPA